VKFTYRHTLHACYLGYVTQAINNNLAPLLFIVFQNQFGLSTEMLGRLILLNFTTQIVADLVAVRYVDRIGYRRSALIAHLLSALGLISLGILPFLLPSPYVGLCLATIIYGWGGGFIEVLISPIVESLPGDAKASAMSLLHSFYCWGQMLVVIVTTVLVRLLGANHWYILPFLWALIPATNFFRFTKVPLRVLVPEEQQMPIRELFRSPSFLIALLLMLSAGASELTMSQWSSYFAEQGLQVPKMIGDLIGPGLFALFMGTGRTIYGVWGERIDLRKALLFTSALCVLCYLLTVFAPHPLLSLAGCSLTGSSVSLMWPGTFSLSARAFPFGGTAIFGDLGGSLGPWSAGLVADLTERGLHAGLLTASVFPLALLIGVQLFSPKKVTEESKA